MTTRISKHFVIPGVLFLGALMMVGCGEEVYSPPDLKEVCRPIVTSLPLTPAQQTIPYGTLFPVNRFAVKIPVECPVDPTDSHSSVDLAVQYGLRGTLIDTIRSRTDMTIDVTFDGQPPARPTDLICSSPEQCRGDVGSGYENTLGFIIANYGAPKVKPGGSTEATFYASVRNGGVGNFHLDILNLDYKPTTKLAAFVLANPDGTPLSIGQTYTF